MKRKTEAFVDPWGVTDVEYTTLEANLFAASLFPYLFFLFFLGKPETAFPKRALFGFKFLLVFVFATIPAGIYAKVHYSDILANVDWLHGGAESLLTITNLLIVLGMREGLRDAEREAKEKREKGLTTTAKTTLRSVDSVVVNNENSSGKSMGDARSENDAFVIRALSYLFSLPGAFPVSLHISSISRSLIRFSEMRFWTSSHSFRVGRSM